MPETYVSTACRREEHQECEDHAVVLCVCPCHQGDRHVAPWLRQDGWFQQLATLGMPAEP